QVTTAVPQPHVTRPRPAKTIIAKPHSPPRRNISRRPSPKPSKFHHKVTTAKVPHVNAIKGVQGNWDKENQEKDKIGSKPDKNGKRGEDGRSQKQLQLKEEEKPKKTKKEWPKTHARIKSY
nr:hypothetical protein [Tanacetum cinerariifolium]